MIGKSEVCSKSKASQAPLHLGKDFVHVMNEEESSIEGENDEDEEDEENESNENNEKGDEQEDSDVSVGENDANEEDEVDAEDAEDEESEEEESELYETETDSIDTFDTGTALDGDISAAQQEQPRQEEKDHPRSRETTQRIIDPPTTAQKQEQPRQEEQNTPLDPPTTHNLDQRNLEQGRLNVPPTQSNPITPEVEDTEETNPTTATSIAAPVPAPVSPTSSFAPTTTTTSIEPTIPVQYNNNIASKVLHKIKLSHLATITQVRHLNRAATELFCLLYVLLVQCPTSVQEMDAFDTIQHHAILKCVENAAFQYRSSYGTYNISLIEKAALCQWAHRISTDPNLTTHLLIQRDPRTIPKESLKMAKAILNRGHLKNNNTTKRSCDFPTRVRNTLTTSHVHLLTWCTEMVQHQLRLPQMLPISDDADDGDGHGTTPAAGTATGKSDQADTSNKPSSLAFNFLPTIPATIKYVKTVQDSTMGGGRRTTINEIKILYATYEPNKNVRCALEEFQGNEVVLLRKLLIKHGLGSCRREVSNK